MTNGESIRLARRTRARMIRKRVAAGAATLFIGVWAVIAVELVTGHDPALAAHKSSTASSGSAATTTITTSSSSTSSFGGSGSSGSGSSSQSATPSAQSSSPSAVTTRQS